MFKLKSVFFQQIVIGYGLSLITPLKILSMSNILLFANAMN